MCHAYYWHAAEMPEEIVEVIQIRNLPVCGFYSFIGHLTFGSRLHERLNIISSSPWLNHFWHCISKDFCHGFWRFWTKMCLCSSLCLIFVICHTTEVILTAMVSQCTVHIVKYRLCTSELTWNFLLLSSNAVHWFYPKDNSNTSKCRAKGCDDKVCQEGLCHLHSRNLQVQARNTSSIYTHGMWA